MKIKKLLTLTLIPFVLFTASCGDDEETTPQNVAPTLASQSFSASESAEAGDVFGTISATDPEGEELTFSITANDNGLFAVNATGALSLAAEKSLDFETSVTHTITVSVSDGELTAEADMTISVVDVNENTAPEISAQSFSTAENTTTFDVIGTLTATDADGDDLTFSLTDGQEKTSIFQLSAEGALTLTTANSLDFETTETYSVNVTVSDGELSATADIAINVTNVNEIPVISGQTFSISENSAAGTKIGTITATDEDGDDLTFSLAAGKAVASVFGVAANGSLTVNAGSILDFENVDSYSIKVTVSDGDLSATADIAINITNVNELPVVEAQNFTVAEDIDAETVIGTVIATDEDGDALTYSITVNSGDLFEINANAQISLVAGKALNFDAATSHTLTVQVMDGNASVPATITINVTDTEDIVNIPNATFKRILVSNSNINTNGDDNIQVAEAVAYTGSIGAANAGITDVTGIEAFINVRGLQLFNNNLTSIDVSKNTKITQFLVEGNDLLELDLTTNSLLVDIKAHSNELVKVNVANGNNSNLTRFELQGNSGLTCIQIDAGVSPKSGWNKNSSAQYSDDCGK